MNLDDTLAERFDLHVLLVRAGRRQGYTLWGGSYPDGTDRLLVADGSVVLCTGIRALIEAAQRNAEASFGKPGLTEFFTAYLNWMPANSIYIPPDRTALDFPAALEVLRGRNARRFRGVSMYIDTIWDLQCQLNPEQPGHDPVLTELYQALWDGRPDDVTERMVAAFVAEWAWFCGTLAAQPAVRR